MPIRIVRLGSPRARDEGPRLGAVRRPPRGVPKAEFASRDYFDVRLPALSPTAELLAAYRANPSEAAWSAFVRALRKQLASGDAAALLDLLAALSHATNFSIGCYCESEARCHRSLLRTLLIERGATIAE